MPTVFGGKKRSKTRVFNNFFVSDNYIIYTYNIIIYTYNQTSALRAAKLWSYCVDPMLTLVNVLGNVEEEAFIYIYK